MNDDHYPVEWGPPEDRRFTCSCGNPDPAHIDIELDALRVRCGELAQQLVDAGILHLADESDIYHLRARVADLEKALNQLLPDQDPLDAEIVCDYCGATVPFDDAQNEHEPGCPWLLMHPKP